MSADPFFCEQLKKVLAAMWIIQSAAILIPALFFELLICRHGEPRPRRVLWQGKFPQLEVANTRTDSEAWSVSVSEHAAARGSSGSKMFGASTAIIGSLQIASAVVQRALCLSTPVSFSFLIVGGIAAILLGQMEAADPDPAGEPLSVRRVKKVYQAVHIGSALAYLGFTAAAQFVVPNLGGFVCAALGLLAFFVFCLMQAASGMYIGTPRTCLLPQSARDRGTDEAPKWALPAHRWVSAHLTLLGRVAMSVELSAFTLVAISQVLGSIKAAARTEVCELCDAVTGGAYLASSAVR